MAAGSFNHEIITSNSTLDEFSTLRNFHYRVRCKREECNDILKHLRASESQSRLRNNTEEICAEKADIFHGIIGTRSHDKHRGKELRFLLVRPLL